MTGRSIDIALTQSEAGGCMESVYENVCTLTTDPELSFNYATTDELNNWGFSEGCFSCFLQDKKDVIIQVITTYHHRDGANCAYQADVDYLKKNDYGKLIEAKTLGEASVLFEKKQSDGTTYNLLFFKNNVFASISAKYKKEKADNVHHIIGLAEKIEGKIAV
ncbi:hypothetical protein [Candidatus Methanoperedens nitratireducens]|uniref:Uncharacterized protein n=1 Tax=Candidatus Methanoperedens nitratireducens TaxID=1392998 RepID=A0A284VN54_9EURY|nr:hypothetical protein [Candidatus Methanoperedens nitroreducens]SNQ60639.1 hypothetical protein MNV_20015 [Candidatus Methanoperedens nitroreducens]